MSRFLRNPTFSIETGELLSHSGESFEEPQILFDRSVQSGAKQNASTANSVAGTAGANASQIGSSLIPGLEQEADHPTGYNPVDLNNMRVASSQALGGANAGVTGQANLEAARTRNAGGFAAALDEAARQKQRQASQNELGLQNENAQLAQQKQQFAQKQLGGLYGTDTSNALKAMGLSNEDLQTELQAGQQGWLQQGEGILNTAANAVRAYKGGSGSPP